MEPNATYDIPSTIGVESIRSRGSAKVRPMRTYREDVTKMVTETGVTKTDIALAEERRREEKETKTPASSPHERSHLGMLIFVLVLVFAFGLGIGAYALFSTKTPAAVAPSAPPVTKDTLTIDIANSPREQIFADVTIAFGKTTLSDGGSREVDFLMKGADGSSVKASAQELLRSLSPLPLPSNLLSSLDEDFSYRIIPSDGLSGVLLFSSRSHDATFASFYDLEPKLADLFVPLVAPQLRGELASVKGRSFHDEHIGATDARVLSDPAGNVFLAYGFIDRSTFLIAGSRSAFSLGR